MLCTSGPVRSPVELSLEPEFNRKHSSVYDALHHGRVAVDRLRRALVARTAAARQGEPLMFAIDTTPLARPDARFADQRTMVMVRGKGPDVFLPGWNFSVLVGIGWGASSWVDPIEARRLRATGRRSPGDPLPRGSKELLIDSSLASATSPRRRRLRPDFSLRRLPLSLFPDAVCVPCRNGGAVSVL
jgi:hypothetical protein